MLKTFNLTLVQRSTSKCCKKGGHFESPLYASKKKISKKFVLRVCSNMFIFLFGFEYEISVPMYLFIRPYFQENKKSSRIYKPMLLFHELLTLRPSQPHRLPCGVGACVLACVHACVPACLPVCLHACVRYTGQAS